MGIYVPWLADAAKATGYPVVEEAGWRTRGRGGFRVVEGVVGHHTAGPKTGEYPCRNIILRGHSTLPGPLANYGLGRSGTIYVVAAGVANHAGISSWAGYSNLNDEFIGIEAEDDGDGTWTEAQRDCYPRLVAAILMYLRRPVSRYAGHKDIAPSRKIDPRGIDSNWMRSKANHYLVYPDQLRKGAPTPVPYVPGSVPTRVLGLGDKGEDVKWVQQRLSAHGIPTTADGDFGPKTEANVKSFQTSRKIEADGLVGKVTVSYLGANTTKEEPPVTEAEMDRIAEKVFAKLQPKGGDSLGTELDYIRRDIREIGKKLGLEVLATHSIDGKIES